jgi:hypothetical protein
MVSAVGAIDPRRTAEFGDRDHDPVLPGVAEVRFERVEGGVEPLPALSEIALRRALVEVSFAPFATPSANDR